MVAFLFDRCAPVSCVQHGTPDALQPWHIPHVGMSAVSSIWAGPAASGRARLTEAIATARSTPSFVTAESVFSEELVEVASMFAATATIFKTSIGESGVQAGLLDGVGACLPLLQLSHDIKTTLADVLGRQVVLMDVKIAKVCADANCEVGAVPQMRCGSLTWRSTVAELVFKFQRVRLLLSPSPCSPCATKVPLSRAISAQRPLRCDSHAVGSLLPLSRQVPAQFRCDPM